MPHQRKQILIYTDGSSLGNPGPGGWGAVFVFDDEKVKEIGGRKKETTNNAMELTAVSRALEEVLQTKKEARVKMFMDSKYVLNGVTSWMYGWEQNGWKTKAKESVKNLELWKRVLKSVREVKNECEISFEHIPGHSDHPGNERADDIAREFAEGKKVKPFEGALEDSSLAGKNLEIDTDALADHKAKKSRSKAKAYSYLSLVNGKLEKHSTWSECETRVKGVKDTKFKKTTSKEDEQEILRGWGFT